MKLGMLVGITASSNSNSLVCVYLHQLCRCLVKKKYNNKLNWFLMQSYFLIKRKKNMFCSVN